jgi:multicomponent Na+:H+ antiporter subunit G
VRDVLVTVLVSAGAFFFLAGTVGLLRFPDVFSRLHALTKADNLGLGMIVAGLALDSASWLVGTKLVVTWLLVLGATATTCHLIARTGLERGIARLPIDGPARGDGDGPAGDAHAGARP